MNSDSSLERSVGWAKARQRRAHHVMLGWRWSARFALPTLRTRNDGGQPDSDFKHRKDVTPRSRGMIRPRFASLRPVIEQRAQGRPGARCTRGLVCKLHIRKRTRAYRFSGGNPAFPARWCYGLLRALPGDRLSCHRHPQELLPRTWRQHRGARTTRLHRPRKATIVSRDIRVHRIPPHVRDDREPPLLSGETGELVALICPTG